MTVYSKDFTEVVLAVRTSFRLEERCVFVVQASRLHDSKAIEEVRARRPHRKIWLRVAI